MVEQILLDRNWHFPIKIFSQLSSDSPQAHMVSKGMAVLPENFEYELSPGLGGCNLQPFRLQLHRSQVAHGSCHHGSLQV